MGVRLAVANATDAARGAVVNHFVAVVVPQVARVAVVRVRFMVRRAVRVATCRADPLRTAAEGAHHPLHAMARKRWHITCRRRIVTQSARVHDARVRMDWKQPTAIMCAWQFHVCFVFL
jgi:hypothetical protein